MPMIKTLLEPATIESGGPTQIARSPTLAAGRSPMRTVGAPGPTIGPPIWGMGGTPGVSIGHWCMSERRAAAGMSVDLHEGGVDRQFGSRLEGRGRVGLQL